MKLFYSTTSPYSRKVRLVLREKALLDQLEEIRVNPFGEDTATKRELIASNPLGKIPTLLLDNGTSLFDSPVICHYLDSLSENKQLIPSDNKINILRWEALSDGLTDATYNIAIERKRSENEQSNSWIKRWAAEIERTLLYIEDHFSDGNFLEATSKNITLAHLALASAISYLELRFPEGLYEQEDTQIKIAPNTMQWYESFKERESMTETQLIDLQ